MSFSAGTICKFNCCQEGRDLPEDNLGYNNGRGYHLCKPHFFLIVSNRAENSIEHDDWSKLISKSEKDRIRKSKTCTAIPIDIKGDEEKTNPSLCFLNDEDYIEIESLRGRGELSKLKGNKNAILCNKICKVNISQSVSDSICYLHPEAFERVIVHIKNSLERSKRELSSQLINFGYQFIPDRNS